MNKVTDPQPRIYAFVYELGKMEVQERTTFVNDIEGFLQEFTDILVSTDDIRAKFPEFKLGEEARAAKAKVEDLKPKKKTKKEKK
jgi:hypothetical protein